MPSLDQIKQRVDSLTRRYNAASKKKAEYKGQLEAKKDELVALKREIEAAGFDPKNLKRDRERLEAELATLLDATDKELSELEAAHAELEKSK